MSADQPLLEAVIAALESATPKQRARIRAALALDTPTPGAPPEPVPVLLTVAQAAKALSCSTTTVRRRLRDGSIPAVKDHGGRTVIRTDELRAYVEGLERYGPMPGQRRTRAPRTRRSPYPRLDEFDFLRK
jgi:excisionase family DNA binding protein